MTRHLGTVPLSLIFLVALSLSSFWPIGVIRFKSAPAVTLGMVLGAAAEGVTTRLDQSGQSFKLYLTATVYRRQKTVYHHAAHLKNNSSTAKKYALVGTSIFGEGGIVAEFRVAFVSRKGDFISEVILGPEEEVPLVLEVTAPAATPSSFLAQLMVPIEVFEVSQFTPGR